ncbi:GNAT family N-acetyltransferase [Methylocapsa acidiphila]|uniref:GNAT family N-acetyltransferase n=1 Tax=Methylocapsa acidiphila TaxID=133552 RepID=UPI000406E949|nr:GNAT family N-acetyltransferase [Methylocapsa acidiphila]
MPLPYTVHIAQSMDEIDAAQWDACANPEAHEIPAALRPEGDESIPIGDSTESQPCAQDIERFNPFITHAFLQALESSKSVAPRHGWTPTHIVVKDAAGRLSAAAPAYLKTHSMGEYVFDFGWADAYQRAGVQYYPKLQIASPFTPATGRRLLVAPGHGETARQTLIAGSRAWREKIGASSIHVTFPTRAEWETLGAAGFLQRTGQQFHFINKGYADFEAFLADLASRKRKMIRRERKEALAPGIEIERLTGAAITEAHWDSFFLFYQDTGARKWGTPYLTRAFFSAVGAAMADHILLVMAKRNGRYIAGAINFIGKDALYGRNWGAIEEHPFLHFEVCYYQAIEFAILRGLARVEAGAQGEHKLARGYGPVPTYSAHDIADKRFARAIDEYLQRERVHIDAAMEEYGELTPFKKGP